MRKGSKDGMSEQKDPATQRCRLATCRGTESLGEPKRAILREAVYRLIRYTNDQVEQHIDAVLADLRCALLHSDNNDISPSPAAAGEGVGG
jgi:hypothetical protein